MVSAHKAGDCMVTCSTGTLTAQEEEVSGLVTNHAYAVLLVKEIEGRQLLKVKNPWASRRWKGNYSHTDFTNWTPSVSLSLSLSLSFSIFLYLFYHSSLSPLICLIFISTLLTGSYLSFLFLQLKKALGFDHRDEWEEDNGTFWIDFKSLCHFYGRLSLLSLFPLSLPPLFLSSISLPFTSPLLHPFPTYFKSPPLAAIYINWNPALFRHRCTIHDEWLKDVGPKVNAFSREYCPQYELEVKNDGPGVASVWVLLSKHEIEKKEEDTQYIAVHIYNNDQKGLIYYPENAVLSGTYINNIHFLSRMNVDPGTHRYQIVVSQYEKTEDLSYTVNVYSTSDISLRSIRSPYPKLVTISGEWDEKNAGGSLNHPLTFLRNPMFEMYIHEPCSLIVKLKCPKQYSGHISAYKIHPVSSENEMGESSSVGGGRLTSMMELDNGIRTKKIADSGPYRGGFCYFEITAQQLAQVGCPCNLTLVASTYEQSQLGPFIIEVGSNSKVDVRIKPLP